MASSVAHRSFCNFPSEKTDSASGTKSEQNSPALLRYIDENLIGNDRVFSSPFGPRKVSYCDYTASGRSLRFIEDYILDQILPLYGSTHTTTSVTSMQTTLFRHEARDIIRNATRASEHDRVIFTGSGATSAIHKLINGMSVDSHDLIVFVDAFAHHSTLLPWRDMGATVYRVRETSRGYIDENHLEKLLQNHQDASLKLVGCFTAASNVTGSLAPVDAVTILLHKYGALAFWDYATAAPYVDLVMNPVLPGDDQHLAYKDAVFFSLHKFYGGVQTPGVLIAKKNLFGNNYPTECGGGTVFFVSRDSHRYLQDVEEREEGGTPPIVETIRGGMAMQLKMSITPSLILQKCFHLSERIKWLVGTTPNLVPLGNVKETNRLPILSFNVKSRGKLLHFNFVSAVLNDLFGIQSRGGCACAGPYVQDLLGIDEKLALKYETLLMETPELDRDHLRRKEEHGNLEVLRPGFVRINLPFTAGEEQIEFVLSAIKKVCKDGWKLLPQYNFNPETAEWKHHTNLVFKNRQWLQNISYSGGTFSSNLKEVPNEAPGYQQVLTNAEEIFEKAVMISQRRSLVEESLLFSDQSKDLLWFICPSEAQKCLSQSFICETKEFSASNVEAVNEEYRDDIMPFVPVTYPLSDKVLKNRSDFIWNKKTFNRNRPKTQIDSLNNEEEMSKLTLVPNSKSLEDSDDSKLKLPEQLLSIVKKVTEERLLDSTEMDERSHLESKLNCLNGSCLKRKSDPSELPPRKTQFKVRWVAPTKNIFNPTLEAIRHFKMIEPGDKVLVCLSGGKDSLTLLHTLHQFQFYFASRNLHFDLGAVTVDPMSSSYDPRPLIPYLEALGVQYLYEQQDIFLQAKEIQDLNSICSFCSRMKRGRIYAAARSKGFNVLALGHHLDDIAESFLMSTFHNGRLRTMKAAYSVKEEDLKVIRPFVYVREKHLRLFAETKKLPVIPDNCPACFEAPKERHRVKQLLAQQEIMFPKLFFSLRTAMLPLMAISEVGDENRLFGKKGVLERHEGHYADSKEKDSKTEEQLVLSP